MQISPASTQSQQPAPPDPLNCNKRETMASGNIGLIKSYMFFN